MGGPAGSDVPRFLARLAGRAESLVAVDDSAITRFSPPDRWEVVHATAPAVQAMEDAAFTLGEGPMWDAWHEQRRVLVPDVAATGSRRRWPTWSAAVGSSGYRAVAAFPVQLGVVLLGTFSVYRHAAGVFTDQQVGRAGALADAVLIGLLDELAGVPPGVDPTAPREFIGAAVYQASGMVMVQLGIDATQALVALRARAFAEGRPLREVAADVVSRRVRFPPEVDPA